MWRHLAVLSDLIPERALVLSGGVDHLCYWLACDLERLRGGRFFGFTNSGRPSGMTQVVCDATTMALPREPAQEDCLEADRQVQEIKGGVKPVYMVAPQRRLSVRQRIVGRAVFLREWWEGNYFVSPASLLPRFRMIERLKWRYVQQRVTHHVVDEITEPFIYFPLHLEPEATTLVFSPMLRHQAFLIQAK